MDISNKLGISYYKDLFKWRLFKRTIKHIFQLIFKGFSDAETYSLDHSIGRFAYKRLKRFRELNCGYPGDFKSIEEWDKVLEEIEWFLKVHCDGMWDHDDLDRDRYEKAGQLFGKYFGHLWW